MSGVDETSRKWRLVLYTGRTGGKYLAVLEAMVADRHARTGSTLIIASPSLTVKRMTSAVRCKSLIAMAAALGLVLPSNAAPAKAGQRPSSLSFQVTARVGYEASTTEPPQEQTFNGKVCMRDGKIRLETELGDTPLIVIYAPPHIYRLLPASKTGVRYSADRVKSIAGLPSDERLQVWLRNPTAIRATLQQHGAKRVGSERLQGVLVDIFVADNIKGKQQKVKAWLRKSDALPLRLEMTSQRLRVTASWRNYKPGVALSPALFQVPKEYHVRDGRG